MALLTAAQARLLIPALTSTGSDTELDTYIARATEALASYCYFPPATAGQTATLVAGSYVFYLDGPDPARPDELVIPVRPLVSITSIYDDENRAYGASTEVASSNWDLDLGSGRVILKTTSSHAWSTARRAIKATAICGIATLQVTEQVQNAIAEVVAHNWTRKRTANLQNANQGGQSMTFVGQMYIPEAAKYLIHQYVLHERGFSGSQAVGIG